MRDGAQGVQPSLNILSLRRAENCSEDNQPLVEILEAPANGGKQGCYCSKAY